MPELVAVEGRPGPAFVRALQDIWEAGDAVLPVDDRLPRPAIDRLYRALRPTRIGERRVDGRGVEDGDALVVATSGTTGEPKGVVLTHAAVEAAARATSSWLSVVADRDAWVCCLPVAHAGGLGVVTRAIITGTELHVHPGFDATDLEREARGIAGRGKRALTSLVATTLSRTDPSLFGVILLGGDRPPRDLPVNVVVTYGMTETGGGCVYNGVPLHGVEIAAREGELLVRAAQLGRAYRGPEEDQPLTDADGWFATGDGGTADTRRRVIVHGRLADVIVTGGEKVWPAPVEEAIATCPGVEAVTVVGRDDKEWGQRVVALVVPAAGAAPPSLHTIRAKVQETLPAWAAPKELELVAEIPMTTGGKVKRESASRRR
ncbi:MAG: AMP-binding protein [Acidimicrobiales bacterium]